MTHSFQFNTCPSIINEIGSVSRIATFCHQLQIQKPLIVTDSGIVSLGLHNVLNHALELAKLNFGCFSEVEADPSDHLILKAASIAKDGGFDGIIGFGGGSSLDTAKLVALLAVSKQSLSSIYGVDNATDQRLPLILIPTTAGTGSEVTPIAIVTTGKNNKTGVVAKQLLPDMAILDAKLTLGLPSHITAMTGIDAMVHAIEAFTSVHKKNPYSDMLAKSALSIMRENIHQAVNQGENIEARQAMLYGACLAGQAFANAPVAAVHALAYPLGSIHHLPHGLSNSLVLPYVLLFNGTKADHWYADLLPLVITDQGKPNAGKASEALSGYFLQLARDFNLPTTLRETGIKQHQLADLASAAMLQTRLLANNPVDMHEADALAIYQQAF